MSGRFWLISFLTLVVGLLVGFRLILPKLAGKKSAEVWQGMRVGMTDLNVLVAETPADMEKGLGGRPRLGIGEGMLFVYPQPVMPRYWMKGMKFPLDFIWIREGKVVDITVDVPAPTDDKATLPLYTPKEPVDGVLEVNVGWVKTNGIRVGDPVRLPAWQLQK